MPIEITCTKCLKQLRVPESAAGKMAKCPECGELMSVPAGQAPLPPVSPYGPAPTPLTPLGTPSAPIPLSDPSPSSFGSIPLSSGGNPFSESRGPQSFGGGSVPSENPYAPSGHVPNYPAYVPMGSREQALSAVAAPAILMIINASITFFVQLIVAGFGVAMFFVAANGGGRNNDIGENAIFGIITLLISCFQLGVSAFAIYGALQLKSLNNYNMALIGTICTFVLASQICSCGCLGLPLAGISIGVGIFALTKINDSQIRPHFFR